MSAVALLNQKPKPTDDDIDNAMNGNICRCATYIRIRQAIHRALDDDQHALDSVAKRGPRSDRQVVAQRQEQR